MRTIDIHAHFYPKSYLELIGERGARFGASYKMTEAGFHFHTPSGSGGPLPIKFIEPKPRLAEMDEQDISIQALSLSQPMVYWADNETSHLLARAWNDGASEMHRKHPDRFVSFMTLPMLDPDRAVDEIERASALPGMRGVYMGTNINGRDLSDPLFAPIFAHIEKRRLPVFLHPLQPVGEDRLNRFLLHNSIGYPVDTAIAACHLIFGGVLDRHPDLEINLPHAGGVLPILIGRLDHSHRVAEAARNIPRPPSEYLRRFTYDTIAHSKPIMEFVISQVGIDRIMLGSDYCFAIGCKRPLEMVNELGLSAEEHSMVVQGTASRLLRL
jgi:aminocarboxymuconate-semialdehyde decarboxylase